MVGSRNDTRLVALVRAALAEADTLGNTLVAAMLAECIDAIQRGRLH